MLMFYFFLDYIHCLLAISSVGDP